MRRRVAVSAEILVASAKSQRDGASFSRATRRNAAAMEGAALHVGKEVAFSDSSGRFQLRVSRHGPYALRVAPDEFLSNIVYEVVTAPSQVRAESDAVAQDIEVVVRQKMVSRPKP